jgi:hypothetical protein
MQVISQYLSPCSKSKGEASILILLTLFLNNIKWSFGKEAGFRGYLERNYLAQVMSCFEHGNEP